VLRLAPKDFWQMTPREFALAVEAVLGPRAAALARADLDALMRRYPDGGSVRPR
jgi:uncharacterized phage protein (TIGR02216 family)